MAESIRPATMPFRRLSPATGWPEAAGPALGVLRDGGPLRLGVPGQRPVAVNESFGSFGGLRLPRGMAIAPDGRLLLAAPEQGVILSALAAECLPGAAPFRPLWSRRDDPADPWHLGRPTDVALTAEGDLAIADPGSGRVLVLAWPTAAIRRVLALPGWRPTALAVDGAGRLIVADPGLGRLHRFDARGRRDAGWPHASVALGAPDFVAVEAGPMGQDRGCGCEGARGAGERVFALDRGVLVALDAHGRQVDARPGALLPPALCRDGARLLWDDPRHPGRAPLVIPALPLTRDGRLEGADLPVIALPRRIVVPRSGRITLTPFDSGRRGFAWDRLVLDAALPAAGSVVVTTLTSEAELSPERLADQPDGAWSPPLALQPGDPPEVLVQSAPGRYLWLRLDFLSDGSASPEIARIDLYGPRRSGLRHLPASFHQDAQSRDFLDRFLSYFDTIFAEIARAHRDAGMLFDPAAVPEGQWLDWLGSWFDLGFLAEWDVATRREMVAAAIDQARMRGTRPGLQRMIRWHLDLPEPWPMVIEHFRLGPGAPPLAHVPLPQAAEAHRLTIVLPRARVAPEAEARLARLIDGWLPAHVTAALRYVQPGMVIGRQSLLGVDTLLSGDRPAPLGLGRAGIDLAAAPPPARGPVHLHHTLGGRHV